MRISFCIVNVVAVTLNSKGNRWSALKELVSGKWILVR